MASEARRVAMRFRVQRGVLDFECSTNGTHGAPDLLGLFIRMGELEALQIDHVIISKLTTVAHADCTTAQSPQHVRLLIYFTLLAAAALTYCCAYYPWIAWQPPQCVVCPTIGRHMKAFGELAAYLEKWQEVGVAALADGYSILLKPMGLETILRCILVNTSMIAEQTTPSIEEETVVWEQRWVAQLSSIRDIFPDVDLMSAILRLQEANGDVELVLNALMEEA